MTSSSLLGSCSDGLRVRVGVDLHIGSLVDVRGIDRVAAGHAPDDERNGARDERDRDGAPKPRLCERASKGAHDAGSREGDKPRDDHLACNAPVHLAALLSKTRADDGSGAHLRGREREAHMRGDENRSRRSRLCGETLRSRDLGQALAKRADDAPAAHVGAKSDGEAADGDDPQLRTRTGRLEAHGDQRQRDDAHRLLGVVGTMGERDEARRHRLAVAKS